MSQVEQVSEFFQIGGALDPEHPSYVVRNAEDALLKVILRGEFAYVLTSRQMGKTSLVNYVARELEKKDVRVVKIDLSGMGQPNIEAFYYGILFSLNRSLSLSIKHFKRWWQAQAKLTPVQRFRLFLEDEVLTKIKEPLIIFVDEIDKTLQFDFSDDFFAVIRSFYNARADNDDLRRLGFVLLGVASPTDLISDPKQTPFNVGTEIGLQDFTPDGADKLQALLQRVYPAKEGAAIFERIYYWTDGHPFLTQKLCKVVAENAKETWDGERIDELVKASFEPNKVDSDSHLKNIQGKLLNHYKKDQLLRLYRAVFRGKRVKDDRDSVIQTELKLFGLVKADKDGYLTVRNRIYSYVFDEDWIKEQLPVKLRDVLNLTFGIAILILVIILGYNSYWVPGQANDIELNFYQSPNATEKLTHLATLFELEGFFGFPDYDDKATTLFLGLSPEMQVELFDEGNEASVVVIEKVYELLVKVDEKNDNRPLLKAMSDSLDKVEETEQVRSLKTEIKAWLDGQNLAAEGEYRDALDAYDIAINLNNNNSATLYERATINIALGDYEAALADLNEVIGIARQEATATPVVGTATPTEVPTDTPTPIPTNTATPILTNTPAPLVSNTPTTMASDTTITPTTTPDSTTQTPSVEVSPTPTPYETTPETFNFNLLNKRQLINIARNLIDNDRALSNALIDKPDSYAHLWDFEMVATPTSTVDPSETFLYRIRVIDSRTAEDLSGALATIVLGGNDSPRSGFTDDIGIVIFSIPFSYDNSLVQLQVEAEGYESLDIIINVSAVSANDPVGLVALEPITPISTPTTSPTIPSDTPVIPIDTATPISTPTGTPAFTSTTPPTIPSNTPIILTDTPIPTPTNAPTATPIPQLGIILRQETDSGKHIIVLKSTNTRGERTNNNHLFSGEYTFGEVFFIIGETIVYGTNRTLDENILNMIRTTFGINNQVLSSEQIPQTEIFENFDFSNILFNSNNTPVHPNFPVETDFPHPGFNSKTGEFWLGILEQPKACDDVFYIEIKPTIYNLGNKSFYFYVVKNNCPPS